MAASLNKVMLIGYVGGDSETRYTQSGTAYCSLSVATRESWTDNGGEKKEHTEWHRVITWSRLAEICGEYLTKGRQVYIEGRIRTNKWEDDDGNSRETKQIVASQVQMLGQAPNKNNSTGGEEPPVGDEGDDDIPF